MPPPPDDTTMAERRLILLAALSLGLAALYLGWGLRQPLGYILGLRTGRLAQLVLVGASIGAATVMFQTLAGNRLLTPGIIGFDALFVALQTFLVLILGGGGYAALSVLPKFLIETASLTAAGLLLFGLMLRKGASDLLRLILTGVILGVLLRGLASFAQRLLDPSEFAVVQQASFASFGPSPLPLLVIAAFALALALAAALRLSALLDVATLGRDAARTLGVDHDRLVLASLAVIALMVAVSTALVGPVTFLGLLAASLAHSAVPGHRHRHLIPAAALIGAAILIAGQFTFERLLGLQSSLAVIVEFLGGLLFLALILRRHPA